MEIFYISFFNFDYKKINEIVSFCLKNNVKKVIMECAECEYEIEVNSDEPELLKKLSTLAAQNVKHRLKENTEKYVKILTNNGIDVVLYPPKIPEKCEKTKDIVTSKKHVFSLLINGVILLLIAVPITYILDKIGRKDLGEKITKTLTLPPLRDIIEEEEECKVFSILEFAKKFEEESGLNIAVVLEEGFAEIR